MAKREDRKIGYRLLEDGISPGVAPWGAVVRLPLEVSIEPNHTRLIRLGVAFDVPCLLFSAGALEVLRREGVVRVDFPACAGGGVLSAGDLEVQVAVTNVSQSTVRLEERAAVVQAAFIPSWDIQLERR